MSTKEYAEKLVAYMKKYPSKTIDEKCKMLGITFQYYYNTCRKHGVDARIKKSKNKRVDEAKVLKLLEKFNNQEDLDNEECTSYRDDSE